MGNMTLGSKACDWRVMLSDECNYVEQLRKVTLASLICSVLMCIISFSILLIRRYKFQRKLIRPPPESAPKWFWLDSTNAVIFLFQLHFLCNLFSCSLSFSSLFSFLFSLLLLFLFFLFSFFFCLCFVFCLCCFLLFFVFCVLCFVFCVCLTTEMET